MRETLEYRARSRAREAVWALKDLLTRPTANRRGLPDYLVIGAQRCGTTSLQNLIASHPDVTPPLWRKGIHYFDTEYHRGSPWYRSQFPVARPGRMTGEGSPYYLFHPLVAERIADLVPRAKLLVLLRDPIERAISHYKHELRRGFETLDIVTAMRAESERLEGEEAKMRADPAYYSFAHQHFSYQARGDYAGQLARYLALFPKRQMLVLQSESYWSDPKTTWDEVLQFLELPDWKPAAFPHLNATRDREVAEEVRDRLKVRFERSNQQISSQWGIGKGWQ
jgi:hypothetical protein